MSLTEIHFNHYDILKLVLPKFIILISLTWVSLAGVLPLLPHHGPQHVEGRACTVRVGRGELQIHLFQESWLLPRLVVLTPAEGTQEGTLVDDSGVGGHLQWGDWPAFRTVLTLVDWFICEDIYFVTHLSIIMFPSLHVICVNKLSNYFTHLIW